MYILVANFISGGCTVLGHTDSNHKANEVYNKLKYGNSTIFNQLTKGRFPDFPIKDVSYYSIIKSECL